MSNFKYTIFSVDDQTASGLIMFRLQYNLSGAQSKLVDCMGCYKGVEEPSFICATEDFERFVWGMGAVDKQESVMQITECNKQYAQLLYSDFSTVPSVMQQFDDLLRTEFLGSVRAVPEATARLADSWTFRPDINVYFITVFGNNDNVPPPEGWPSRQKQEAEAYAREIIAEQESYWHKVRVAVCAVMIACLIGLMATLANAEPVQCGNSEQVRQTLSEVYGERFVAEEEYAGLAHELWANPDTGGWSVIVLPEPDIACLVNHGVDEQFLQETL